jgi:hypothetical protein
MRLYNIRPAVGWCCIGQGLLGARFLPANGPATQRAGRGGPGRLFPRRRGRDALAGRPGGLTITHRGGESLDQRDLSIRVTPGGRSGLRASGIGSSRWGGTQPLWNDRIEGPIEAGATATVPYYPVPSERIGGQSTDALIHGRSTCGIRPPADGRIVLTDRPASNRNCQVDGSTPTRNRSVGSSSRETRCLWSGRRQKRTNRRSSSSVRS